MTVLRWERAPYGQKAKFVDTRFGRYLVVRSAPRARTFLLKLNNHQLGLFNDAETAMQATMEHMISLLPSEPRQAVLDDYYEAEKADAQSGREEEDEEEGS